MTHAQLASLSTAQVLRRYPHLLQQQQQRQQQQQQALQQMWSHRRLAYTAKNPCLRAALQQHQQQQQQQQKQTQEVGLFAEYQTKPLKRETVSNGRLPVGPQGTLEVGELVSPLTLPIVSRSVPFPLLLSLAVKMVLQWFIAALHLSQACCCCSCCSAAAVACLFSFVSLQGPVPIGAVHLSVAAWQREHPGSAVSAASLGQALHAAAAETLGAPEGAQWAPAVVGFERETTGAWRALRDGIVVVETAAAAITVRWEQIAAEREAAAAKRRDRLRYEKLQGCYNKWRALLKAILYATGYSQQQQQQQQQSAAAPEGCSGVLDLSGNGAPHDALQAGAPPPPPCLSNTEAQWEVI